MSLRSLVLLLGLPPVNLLLLAILGFALSWRWRRAGRALVALGLAGLLLLAMPGVAAALLGGLERSAVPAAVSPAVSASPAAIVILGGDLNHVAGPPWTVLGPLTLERLRTGARLARSSGLPVLVTGGVLGEHEAPIAALMAESLAQDDAVPVRWIESEARDTWENAERSAALLRRDGIASVFLVTQGWHMPRAVMAFRHFGVAVVPAPTQAAAPPENWGDAMLPQAGAWLHSYYAMHEWIGVGWYTLRIHAGW
jgi:uncharacterized SAM-binding protein YcdF (DUF218 family)